MDWAVGTVGHRTVVVLCRQWHQLKKAGYAPNPDPPNPASVRAAMRLGAWNPIQESVDAQSIQACNGMLIEDVSGVQITLRCPPNPPPVQFL